MAEWDGLDWAMATIVALSMVLAFRRGLVRAIFGLLGFLGGFQLASYTYTDVAERIHFRYLQSMAATRIVAFLLIVVVVAVAFDLVGKGLQKSLRAVGLSTLDRMLGAVFGFARGCLICIGLLMAITTLAPGADAVTKSTLSPYLFVVSRDVSFLVPHYLEQQMIGGAVDIRQNAPLWINRH